jgi:hypothetical protein
MPARPTYTCRRRLLDSSRDRVVDYDMVYVESQKRWKIFLVFDPTADPPIPYPDIENDDPIAFCDVPDVVGYDNLFPPTVGWEPNISMSISKGCYSIVNIPGYYHVIEPKPFYIPFGQKVDTIWPGTDQEQQVTTTYFQQATYQDGYEDSPPTLTIYYIFFKVDLALPGGYWVLSNQLDGAPIYMSETSEFPPVFTIGTAPMPKLEMNQNWVAGAYAPPRQLQYGTDVVGETLVKVNQDITGLTEVEPVGTGVLQVVKIPRVTDEERQLTGVVSAEGDAWVLRRVWKFFPKHYEMHHYPYEEYYATGIGSETTNRSASSNLDRKSGYIGARCNRHTNPLVPVVEHYTSPEETTSGETVESMTSSYSNTISPYLAQSCHIERVDWVQHDGNLGGAPSGTYNYSSASTSNRGGELEESHSLSKAGAGIDYSPGTSYLRMQPFTFQPEMPPYEKPYHGIGARGELGMAGSGTLNIDGESEDKTRPNHGEHIQVCPIGDYDKYHFTFEWGEKGLVAAELAWDVCATVLNILAGEAPPAATLQGDFYGTELEFLEHLMRVFIYDVGPFGVEPPCTVGPWDCCNFRVTVAGMVYDLMKTTRVPGAAKPGIGAGRYYVTLLTKVKAVPPIDTAHLDGPIVEHDTTFTETLGVGSSHSIKGFNYMNPLDPHEVMLHCPISTASENIANSSWAEIDNTYKALSESTAKIYSEYRRQSINFQKVSTKEIPDAGLVQRSLSYTKIDIWRVSRVDATFNPETGEVLIYNKAEDNFSSIATTVPPNPPDAYDGYDQVTMVSSGTYTKASVDAEVDKPTGTLLTKWSESSGDGESLYTNTKGTELL